MNLSSIFGGGGGIFGALLGVASMFFPPLAVMGSLSNLLTGAIGEAIKGALTQLVKEHGFPKFLQEMIEKAVKEAVDGAKQDSTPETDSSAQSEAGDAAKSFQEQFQKSVVENAVQNMKGKKKGSGSWLEALAEALGKALDAQAAKIQELSSQITDQNAKDKPSTMTELQTASQRLSFMMNAADQVIKTIGEALAAMSRKQ